MLPFKPMATGLFLLFLTLFMNNCGRGTSKESAATGGCSVEQKSDGTAVVECEDGSSAAIAKGKDGKAGVGCQTRPDPQFPNQGFQIRCPADNEWKTIRNGRDGSPGRNGTNCRVMEAETGRNVLVCENVIVGTKDCEFEVIEGVQKITCVVE